MEPLSVAVGDDAFEPETMESPARSATARKGGPSTLLQPSLSSKLAKSCTTLLATDDPFLEREGSYMRRCNTASSGAMRKAMDRSAFKVLKSTADFRLPENTFAIAHGGKSGASQLGVIRRTTPVPLKVSPGLVDFGVLCENCVYRFPVELLNTSGALLRFRLAVEMAEPEPEAEGEMERGEASSRGPVRSNALAVVCAPVAKTLVHGLVATIFIEITTGQVGAVSGVLRINTSSGHLLTTPIRAVVATKADFASSEKKAEAIGAPPITSPQVVHMRCLW